MCSLEVCRKPSCKMCEKWLELRKIRDGERSYFWFTPPPTPRDRAVSNNSPPPDPKGWICPGGCPGGKVTDQIEPCIRNINVFTLSLSSTCLLLRCFILRMVLHRGERETQVTGYMQIFIEREMSGYKAGLVLFHRYKQWKKVHQNKTNLVQEWSGTIKALYISSYRYKLQCRVIYIICYS